MNPIQSKIVSLESKLPDTRVITYIVSDRVLGGPQQTAKMALDVIPFFYERLLEIGKVDKIALFIFSQGGDIIVPLRLVSLIREYCNKFIVIVPYKAHSAATLVALGADSVIMGPMSELSPIDPSIGTPFNPSIPENPTIKPELGVEDIIGYLNFAKDKAGITDQANLVKILEKLIDKVHPIAIGNIYRSHCLIRNVAHKLLKLHMREKNSEHTVTRLVEVLAEKLYFHGYLINRHEARDLGLPIEFTNENNEKEIYSLFNDYKELMGLGQLFNPSQFAEKEKIIPLCLIETTSKRSSLDTKIKVTPQVMPQMVMPNMPANMPMPSFTVQIENLGWKTE